MARNEGEWKTVSIRKELLDLAEEGFQKFGYPNATQYVNEALRDRLRKDGLFSEVVPDVV